MELVTILCWITSPSCRPSLSMILAILSEINRRIRLSSSDTKNCEEPTSPCLPALPRSCLSTLLDSCRSVPMMARPPATLACGVSLMSVPLPAMLVAMVTVPALPASAMISASFWWCLALSTWCFIFCRFSILLMYSEISTEVVPTSTGRSCLARVVISSITAWNFSWAVLYTLSSLSSLMTGWWVGVAITSSR